MTSKGHSGPNFPRRASATPAACWCPSPVSAGSNHCGFVLPHLSHLTPGTSSTRSPWRTTHTSTPSLLAADTMPCKPYRRECTSCQGVNAQAGVVVHFRSTILTMLRTALYYKYLSNSCHGFVNGKSRRPHKHTGWLVTTLHGSSFKRVKGQKRTQKIKLYTLVQIYHRNYPRQSIGVCGSTSISRAVTISLSPVFTSV